MRGTSRIVALGAGWFLHFAVEHARGAEGPILPDQSSGQFKAGDVANGHAATSNIEEASFAELESQLAPLPEAQRIFTHTYRAGQITTRMEAADEVNPAASRAGLPEEELIYSNTGGARILRFYVPNRRLGDDLQTDAIEDCNLSRYLVRVNGGVPNGTGEFSCTTGLFAGCQNFVGPSAPIPGTAATFTGLNDDSAGYHDLIVDVSLSPIPIPADLWVWVDCSIASAGWVGGVPAEIGFTQDVFFHPIAGCGSFLGPTFFSGFYLQIWASNDPLSPCKTQYPAYSTGSPNGSLEHDLLNLRFADDFQTALAPTGDSCVLSAYEIAVRGTSGNFTLKSDLRVPFENSPLPGTDMDFQARGLGGIEIVRKSVEAELGVILQPSSYHLTWEVSKRDSAVMFADGVAIGFSDATYVVPCPFPLCDWTPPFDGHGTFYLRVFCRGEDATGACCRLCDNQVDATCSDEILAHNCIDGRWAKHEKCADEPFDPPCGTGACKPGVVEWLAPGSGTIVDARQPLEPDNPSTPQGVTALIARAPLNADDPACWTLCDTLGNPLDAEVILVEDNGDNTQTLHLEWPITPGAATIVSYANSSGCSPTAGHFEYLPGDVNANGMVLASEDGGNFPTWCLSGQPGVVLERCDIDRSGVISTYDLIRLIDLMNGAGPFDPWLGRTVSTAPCE